MKNTPYRVLFLAGEVGVELFMRLHIILHLQNGKAAKLGEHDHPLDAHASRFDPKFDK